MPLTLEKSNSYAHLVVDTSLFSAEFQAKLLSSLSNDLHSLDDEINGVLIHADNFQALNLLQARYREQVKCIYIDPPYNTGNDGFIYKDGYPHSSWLSLIENRLQVAYPLLRQDGVNFISIDDNEQAKLKQLCDGVYGEGNFVGDFIWNNKYTVSNDTDISYQHEHIICYAKYRKNFSLNLLDRTEKQNKDYKNRDNDPKGAWKPTPIHARSGSADGIYTVTFPNGISWKAPLGRYPRYSKETLLQLYEENALYFNKNGGIDRKTYLSEVRQGVTCGTMWNYEEVGHSHSNNEELAAIFKKGVFSDPKGTLLLKKIIKLATNQNFIILDYFAGSGTTAHAVINLNRKDGGKRKYILVEQGEYFDTVLKPRVQKVIYAQDWKDGKPVANNSGSLNGVSQLVKVLKLESYEDTLNNLVLRNPNADLFGTLDEHVRNDYVLRYMLDMESRDSLLNISHFEKPFDYQMEIATTSAGATEKMNVDLVETFNYLLGARVISMDDKRFDKGFVAINAYLPHQLDDDKTLILWRDCTVWTDDNLMDLFKRFGINPASNSEFSQILINGDHTIPTVWTHSDGLSGSLKVRQIEQVFLRAMFAGVV